MDSNKNWDIEERRREEGVTLLELAVEIIQVHPDWKTELLVREVRRIIRDHGYKVIGSPDD